MKKILLSSMVLFFFVGQAYAQMAGLPSSGVVMKGGWVNDVTIQVEKTSGKLTVTVPVMNQTGNAVLYRSIARVSGGNAWAQISGSNEVVTKAVADQATADLALGDKGIYRVRLWGKVGAGWLHINQASKYYRLDAGKSPAYEFIINTATGEVIPVPNDYPAWN